MTTSPKRTETALLRAARALSLSTVLQGLVRWLAISGGVLLLLIVADSFLNLPTALRLPLVLAWAGWVIYDFTRRVLLPLLRPLSPAQAARILEKDKRIGGNILINALQFENDARASTFPQFIRPTLASSEATLGTLKPGVLWRTSSFRRWFLVTILIAAVAGASFSIFPRYLKHSFDRIIMPLSDIPPMVNWDLEVTPVGPVSIVEGDKLVITAHVTSLTGANSIPPVPELVWQTGNSSLEPNQAEGERAEMIPGGTDPEHNFTFAFDAVTQSFSFRVWVDNAYSPAVDIRVERLPRLKTASFSVTPPGYTGLKPFFQPGPPTELAVPAGSSVTASLELEPESSGLTWKEKDVSKVFEHSRTIWSHSVLANETHFYSLLTQVPAQSGLRVLCEGQITAVPDRPPDVDFVTDERNLLVNPGSSLPVTIRATDDYGVAAVALLIAPGDDATNTKLIKAWQYLGPPGEKAPEPQTYTLILDPVKFTPGATYLLTAQARDFSPAQQRGTSRPIVVRVASLDDLSVPAGDPLERLVALLKQAIVQQTRANGLTDNLAIHLQEALAANDLAQHHQVMNSAQREAHSTGQSAVTEAALHPESKDELFRLKNIVEGEMPFALDQIDKLLNTHPNDLPGGLASLQSRQTHILSELMALLGQIVNERQKAAQSTPAKPDAAPPALTSPDSVAKLKDDLKAFLDKQKKIIDATKSLKELNPEDLTTEQEKLLGDMAREEAAQATFFQEKLTDLSRLPVQDFSDGKLVSDANEVYQEVQAATEALYQKRPEIAVPNQQAALENAGKIEQNLEKWLQTSPDNLKWLMEESQTQQDAKLAELPKELDDVIGDLLQKEDSLDPQDQDATNSAMDSLDKGAGWGAADGPMANMSAKGVTGNQLPKNDEISGRSGEGRNGRSDGQMVGDTAVGKGGKETPTRLTATPFEPGSVNDTSSDTKGGATGGGKLSGSGQYGLRGPLPPPALQRLAYVADQQSKLRQQAESLALQLRKQRKPTGDLETAINLMKQMEIAGQQHDGLAVLQCYHEALSALSDARASYAGDRVSRVEVNSLQTDANGNISETEAEHAPAGYEEMTGAYFRSLSDASTQSETAPGDSSIAPSK